MTLLLAWFLDLLLGDPTWLPHPIVAYGKWIAKGEKLYNKGENRKRKGAIFALVSIALSFILPSLLLVSIYMFSEHFGLIIWGISPLYVLFSAILLFYCLAGTTLIKEVRNVFLALDESLEKGRLQVARIVGRDTQNLSAHEVRTAALETLAENLSDGVIAPLFWYLLLGVPGALTYKMVNTLDSMIGYQNERYKDFGYWAAKTDDVFNFIPARLTAWLMVIVSNKRFSTLWPFVCKYGPQHASPNSGWPEAALAGILDCRFGGSHNYFGEEFYKPYIGENPRQLSTPDMHIATRINRRAECLWVGILLLLSALDYLQQWLTTL